MVYRARRKFRRRALKGNRKDQQQDRAIQRLRRELQPEYKLHHVDYTPTASTTAINFRSLSAVPQGTNRF